jgi:hypothetical protein
LVVVGADPKDVIVVCGVVNLAEGKPVLNDRRAANVRIGDDMSSIEQRCVPQPADRATAAIRADDHLPEGALVKTQPGLRPGVSPKIERRQGDRRRIHLRPQVDIRRIHGSFDEKRARVVFKHDDRPDSLIVMIEYFLEIDEGSPCPEGLTETTVVAVIRISSAVCIDENPVVPDVIEPVGSLECCGN